MEQVDQAALAVHYIVIQFRLHPFPQFQGMRIEFGIAGQEVVGAHDGGIAANAARPDMRFFQHGDVGHTVIFG